MEINQVQMIHITQFIIVIYYYYKKEYCKKKLLTKIADQTAKIGKKLSHIGTLTLHANAAQLRNLKLFYYII